ncbi:hypothetical protein V2G26_008726 [Clonostachys chloroleuca]
MRPILPTSRPSASLELNAPIARPPAILLQKSLWWQAVQWSEQGVWPHYLRPAGSLTSRRYFATTSSQ